MTSIPTDGTPWFRRVFATAVATITLAVPAVALAQPGWTPFVAPSDGPPAHDVDPTPTSGASDGVAPATPSPSSVAAVETGLPGTVPPVRSAAAEPATAPSPTDEAGDGRPVAVAAEPVRSEPDHAGDDQAGDEGETAGEVSGDRAGDDGGQDATTARPERQPRLECAAQRSDSPSDAVVVGCKWTPAQSDRVAGYRLLRAVDDHGREVIFETRNLREYGHRDRVRPGHTYHYAVQYLGHQGQVLATSNAAHVRVPAPEPDVERLDLACQQIQRATADQRAAVACKWSAARGDAVVGYKLIRRDQDGREVVARGGLDFRTHREHVAPGRYAYRVVGVAADGTVHATSGAVTVHVPRPAAEPTDPTDEKPADETSTDETSTDETSTDQRPAADPPTDDRPRDERSRDRRPADRAGS